MASPIKPQHNNIHPWYVSSERVWHALRACVENSNGTADPQLDLGGWQHPSPHSPICAALHRRAGTNSQHTCDSLASAVKPKHHLSPRDDSRSLQRSLSWLWSRFHGGPRPVRLQIHLRPVNIPPGREWSLQKQTESLLKQLLLLLSAIVVVHIWEVTYLIKQVSLTNILFTL